MDRLVLIEYTDPYSVWCWGAEPLIRKTEFLYGESVAVEHRMGGLFEDFTPIDRKSTRLNSSHRL